MTSCCTTRYAYLLPHVWSTEVKGKWEIMKRRYKKQKKREKVTRGGGKGLRDGKGMGAVK